MSITSTQKVLNRKPFKWHLYLILFLFNAGCQNLTSDQNAKIVDSLLFYEATSSLPSEHHQSLNKIRNLIGDNDIPRLSKFYQLKCYYYHETDKEKLNLYADSNMGLFGNDQIIDQYKIYYFKALVQKGDALFVSGKPNQAVMRLLEARSYREKNLDICNNKQLAVSIGSVYFIQGNYLKAASYFKESYNLEQTCKTADGPLQKFNKIQGLLNNIGFCYEKAEHLDSAKYYYEKDITYIDSLKNTNTLEMNTLDNAYAPVYDNLGSIYFKHNNLARAEKLLTQSISLKYANDPNVKIPPMIKLANLYTVKRDFKRAGTFFDSAGNFLKIHPNIEFEASWNKAKAEFYTKQNLFDQAYQHQKRYNILNDLVLENQIKLSSINVEKDINSLEQKYNLQDLKEKDSIKNIYLTFSTFLLILVVLIAFLLYKNIKQSKKNSQIIKLNNEELQESLLKLEDANQNYARIMNVMAHDLKNPLNGISGISSLLLAEEKIDNEDKAAINLIKESADNALGMINEILNSFIFVVGKIKMRKENINVQLVLEQCVSMLGFKAGEKNQKLILIAKSELIIKANKEKLWRLFNNLIVNAIKFSNSGKTIKVNIKELPKHIVVSVEDNGIGIPEESAEKIFDIFTESKRLGTSGEKAYGLGLSISKQIAEAHKGKIWFEKNPEGGTIFYVQLPK